MKECAVIRRATVSDASRIAEILVFSKRTNYRTIFNDDSVSFGEMQVYPLAKEYIDNPYKLEKIWVYDDGFVKGMAHIDGTEIIELYVDTFFVNQGIGGRLTEYAIEHMKCDRLWVFGEEFERYTFL